MSDWQAKASDYKSKCDAKIPAEWRLPSHMVEPLTEKSTRCVLREPGRMGTELGILTPREIEITESEDARYLTRQLARKRYTAVEVVTAFSKRAAISHQLVCPLR
jgi:amidase